VAEAKRTDGRRRTQKERSEETSRRLLAATVDLLHDRGFWRLSTPDIAAAAGVSRGALTHHFDSREEIIVRAIEDLLNAVTADLHRFADEFAGRDGSSDEIVDYLWRMMEDRLFYITMEFLPEARHNAAFRDRLVPVVRDFHAGLDAVWSVLAERHRVEPVHARNILNATMCLFRGMIAQTVLRDDPPYYAALREFWKAQVRQHFPADATHRPAAAAGAGAAATAGGTP
jgi:AcrR family transcriptional regulator